MNVENEDISGYARHYSEASFTSKVMKLAGKAGAELLHKALCLWELLKDPETPQADKTKIIAALGYLISPIDGIPDFIPVIGLGDDLLVIGWILTNVSRQLRDHHVANATAMLRRFVPGFRGLELPTAE